MVRTRDQDERRQRIIEAATRIATRAGTAHLTMRAVAAEAGVSVGQVQHWFASKEDLLRATVDAAATRMTARAAEAVAGLGDKATERRRMRTTLLQLIPLDTPQEASVLLRRGPDAAADGEGWWPLADRTLDAIVRPRLLAARANGELRPDVDVDLETANLVFFVTGTREHLLAGFVTPSQVSAAVTYLLTRLFRKPRRRNVHHSAGGPTSGPCHDTELRILRVAEHHFAARGIERASLRQIAADAGQADRAAVQCHFGGRHGLLLAILARHRRADELRRNTLLDRYEEAGVPDLRALAEALVLPMADNLDDPDGGRAYLRIAAEYYLRTPLQDIAHHRLPDTSIPRWHQLLDHLVPAGTSTARTDLVAPRMAATRIALGELSLLATAERDPGTRPDVTFVVDVVAGVLSTPSPAVQ